jgi:hypothetical protein
VVNWAGDPSVHPDLLTAQLKPGLHRHAFGNLKPSAETEAAIREVMIAAGVTRLATVVAANR